MTPEPTFAVLFAVSVSVVRVVTMPVVAVKVVTIPVVAFKVAAVVIPAISTPVGDSVTVPTPDRLLILSTLISDAIWVHFPPDCFTIYPPTVSDLTPTALSLYASRHVASNTAPAIA